MSDSPADPIGYLASCYEADNRESSIFDLFHKEIQNRHFATETEVLSSGLQAGLAIPVKRGLAALKAAATYKREKSLIYGIFPIVGKYTSSDGTERKLAAPVLYYPARLRQANLDEGEEIVYLSIESAEQRINFPVFAELVGEKDGGSDVLEKIMRRIPEPPFGAAEISELMQIFRDFFPDVQVDELYRWPKLVSEKAVRAAAKESGVSLSCLPAAAMALVPNPRAARGVLFELPEIARNFSPPMRALFGDEVPEGEASHEMPVTSAVPAVLSGAQQKILRSARRRPLTLVVGPPGTGKSYTLSAVALDHVVRGESVLIACRIDRALDVIEDKLQAMLGETTTILRGGSRDYLRDLKAFLKRVLSGQVTDETKRARKLERDLARHVKTIGSYERQLLRRTTLEHRYGELASAESTSLGTLDGIRLRWLAWRVGRATPHWELHAHMGARQEERIACATGLLAARRSSQMARLLATHRRGLKRFLDAIRARTSSRQEKLFAEIDLPSLTQAFPLWMSTFRDLHRLVPFEKELFDVVIVDEATQSDMASPLPALYRARRAVVTGDPEQLRHVSFLSRARQGALADDHALPEAMRSSLDYRDKSLLDLVDDALESQDQVAFLDEHFRSMPQIIAFSNRAFYGGALRVMTARPETLRERAVEIRNVSGRRDANGVNTVEADALVDELARRIEAQAALGSSLSHTIGVLSPFRDQVEHLAKIIHDRLDVAAIDKHDIVIGTAYSFQGDERDVMLLSFAVDAESHPTSLRYLSQPDVFNVSITRARNYQILFTSLAAEAAPKNSLLARYLSEMQKDPEEAAPTTADGPHDAFLEDVTARLEKHAFCVWPRYAVAGLTVDLVVEKNDKAFGIDLIGFPGDLAPAIDLERYRMFRRAGLSLFALPYSAWQKDAELCVDAIERHGRRVVG